MGPWKYVKGNNRFLLGQTHLFLNNFHRENQSIHFFPHYPGPTEVVFTGIQGILVVNTFRYVMITMAVVQSTDSMYPWRT